MKLTKRNVDGIEPISKDVLHWDDELKGFGVKVTPAGKKIFVLQSRLNGSLKRFTIGAFGAPWSADAARDEAKRLLGEIVKGVDPYEENGRVAMTLPSKSWVISIGKSLALIKSLLPLQMKRG